MVKTNVRTIRNVPHELLPMIKDISMLLDLLDEPNSASDHVKLVRELQRSNYIINSYLISLEKEAEKNHIKKAEEPLEKLFLEYQK